MSNRMLELVVDADRVESVERLLSDADVIDWWSTGGNASASGAGSRVCFHALVESGGLAVLLDRLEPLSEGEGGIRVLVSGVDATLPRPPEKEQEAEKDDRDGKSRDRDGLSRVELHEKLSRDARTSSIYLWMVVLSSVVAAVGLIRGNTAVVVGAMVIAPLLAPNMALALAATLADIRLGLNAVRTGMIGVAIAVALGAIAGAILRVDPALPEIASRTEVGMLDVLLALAAGAAGALAVTSGVAGALVGVMVAVALLPPLMVAALLAGTGEWAPASGALLLYSTNVASVNLAGIAVFLARGVTPRKWWEKRRAQRAAWAGMAFWVVTLAILVGAVVWYNAG